MKRIYSILAATALFGSIAHATNPPTAKDVDLNRYLGRWYEVASIPQWFQKDCASNTTAEYSPAEDGLIRVLNSCVTKDGQVKSAEGRARIEDAATRSKLKVTFVRIFDWVFAFGGDYWIFHHAPDYSFSLVGDPSLKTAWLLSRTPNLPAAVMLKAEAKFKELGYDTCEILTSVQSGGMQKRVPLCKLGQRLRESGLIIASDGAEMEN